MGCGSSSTQVETFKNPEENRSHNHSRQHSNPKLIVQAERPKSKSSSKSSHSSRSSSASSRGKKRKDEDHVDQTPDNHYSRNSSANTKHTYTIEHHQEGYNDVIREASNHGEQDELELAVVPQKNIFITSKDTEADDEYGDNDHDVQVIQTVDDANNDEEDETTVFNSEQHETNDDTTEHTKTVRTILDEDEQIILDNGLSPLDIPEIDESRQMQDYTIDDLINDKTLFKYGRKMYSNTIMQPIIQDRLKQYADVTTVPYMYGITHPVHIARRSGVTRKEMKQLLPVCQVGRFVDLPPDQYLSRMKQHVQDILDDEDISELFDYKEQLSRWLQKYPNVEDSNALSDYNTDPNEKTFPIVIDDPSKFRKWIEEWEVFDTEVPESGAWSMFECTDIRDPELAKQVHEQFASIIEMREDKTIDDLDMTIDGEAAWFVIELDIVKNDTATEAQVKIWSLREKRTNLEDREWMTTRRREIADILIQRHEWEADKVSPYMGFAELLDTSWKEFQDLCEKPFDHPDKYKLLYTAKDDNSTENQHNDNNGIDDHATNILQLDDNEQAHSEDDNLDKYQSDEATVNPNNDGSQINDNISIDDHGNIDQKNPENDQNAMDNLSNNDNNRTESNDNKSNEGDTVNREAVQSTPVHNAQQDNGRPTMETMDSGLELDTSDNFYK